METSHENKSTRIDIALHHGVLTLLIRCRYATFLQSHWMAFGVESARIALRENLKALNYTASVNL